MLKTLNILRKQTEPGNRRETMERRAKGTPIFSRYWLLGRRRGGRRDEESANIYVDRYTTSEWILVGGVLVLSVLDMVFTIIHLNAGGIEANPVMAWALEWGGHGLFKAVKLATTLLGLLVLLVHVRFRKVKALLTFAFILYSGIFVFHMYLAFLRAYPGVL